MNHDFAVRVEGCPLAEKFLTMVEACGVVFAEKLLHVCIGFNFDFKAAPVDDGNIA